MKNTHRYVHIDACCLPVVNMQHHKLAELFVRLLSDTDLSVRSVVKTELLPAMVHWSDLIDAFHSTFLNLLLSELQSMITKCDTEQNSEEQDVKQMIDPLLSCFLLTIPRMKEVVFASNPAISTKDASAYESQSIASFVPTSSFTRVGRSHSLPTGSPVVGKVLEMNESNRNSLSPGSSASPIVDSGLPMQSSVGSGSYDSSAPDLRLISDKVILKLKTQFDMLISTQPEGDINTKDWPMLDWVINEFLPRLCSIIAAVPVEHHSVLASLVEVVSALCRNFGVPFTKKVVKSVFLVAMSDSDANNEVNSKRSLLLPAYLSGVLTSLDEAEIIKYLHELIVNISIEENSWGHHHLPVLKEVVGQLSSQANFKAYVILDTLCDMVAHPSNQVRLCIVTLFNVVIPTAKGSDLESKILPALVTLSNDPDSYVRTETIEPLAAIVVNSPSDDALDSVTDAFDKMMETDTHHIQMAIVHGLTNIIPHLTLKRQFRDFCIVSFVVPLQKTLTGRYFTFASGTSATKQH
jgi:hypothetical protein